MLLVMHEEVGTMHSMLKRGEAGTQGESTTRLRENKAENVSSEAEWHKKENRN